jgi:hypothetical protein
MSGMDKFKREGAKDFGQDERDGLAQRNAEGAERRQGKVLNHGSNGFNGWNFV